MASSGKKGKKSKGTVISLQSFLSNGDTPTGTTQVAKKVRNLDGDESDDGSNALPLVYQLPTAPRANRIFDDDSIPHKPPFIAYINNLPFDANEEDIYDFFGPINLVSLRLPREDGETGRSRGFGYVEMDNRDDLIHVLSLPDPSIKGRRIRIELSNENEQNRQKGNRRFEGFGNSSENRDSGNWRRDSQNNGGGFSSYSGNSDRSFNRERKPISEREENNAPGSWRTSTRIQSSDFSPSQRDRDQTNDKFWETRSKNTERFVKEDNLVPEERPKLQLKPRTLPLPEILLKPESENKDVSDTTNLKSSGAPSEKVFGSAKPVDTATRELEIEERLAEARRQEKMREEETVNEKLSEIQIDKNDNENANAAVSWRRIQDPSTVEDSKRSTIKERRPSDSDYNKFNKGRDQCDRSESSKSRTNQSREGKPKEEIKNKRDAKSERSLPKYQPNQSGPVLQSSNKYSGLDDEASE
ncbi:eukaryotic translation initiation factor 4B isoform X2 [Scaptodrosophila lebanonensis]|uniref:Eukaryotic translation initiation factor 4B isoform X2 n=1 Tax=Drosophila lebanonensis TaxID=7225 RepID=A0A6J2TWH8_DROLE|nr:eukaryotic translation initiation factor 4B isoform X2 [Scaptodrosophila lebanonensis]